MNSNTLAALSILAMTTTACATYGDDDMDTDMANAGMNDDMASAGMNDGMRNDTMMVGGAQMYANRNIIENAANSPIHTTLVSAVQAAGLADTLSGPGPFTVFAPTNAAFDKLPAGTVNTLLQPANREQLTSILTHHVVPGTITAENLVDMIRQAGGPANLRTVEGGTLTARMAGNNVIIVDEKGNTATVTQTDVMQSNGIIHVIDSVVMPG